MKGTFGKCKDPQQLIIYEKFSISQLVGTIWPSSISRSPVVSHIPLSTPGSPFGILLVAKDFHPFYSPLNRKSSELTNPGKVGPTVDHLPFKSITFPLRLGDVTKFEYFHP